MKDFSLKYSPWILWLVMPVSVIFGLLYHQGVAYHIPPIMPVAIFVTIPVFVFGVIFWFVKKHLPVTGAFISSVLWLGVIFSMLLFLIEDNGSLEVFIVGFCGTSLLVSLLTIVVAVVKMIFQEKGN